MINIVLYNPQIPPNTGNIMRLCSNTGFSLHLIEPLGFHLDDKSLKRAKLDYFSDINPTIHKNYKSFLDAIDEKKIYAVTKFGNRVYSEIKYSKNIFLLFGSETTGLPNIILGKLKNRSIKIPMINDSRSLNLSNSVAIVVYEVWRQLKFSSAYLSDNIYI